MRNIRYASGLNDANTGRIGSMSEEAEDAQGSEQTPRPSKWSPMVFKMLESAATTFTSVLVLA